MRFTIIDSLSGVDAQAWNQLVAARGDPIFLRHEYLQALESTGCVQARAGWQPCHLLAWQGSELVGALPLYLKAHSYGEYVFDWAWADAYRRHGLAYYPKLVSAVPFTPCPGPRLLYADQAVVVELIAAALNLAQEQGVSSLHVLFPEAEEAGLWQQAGLLARQGVQFHWQNTGFTSFEQMLGAMSHDKRKRIRQDRRYVAEAGVSFRRLEGHAIQAQDWHFFQRCYEHTYHIHHSTPYLNLAFFTQLHAALPEACVLWIAERAGLPVAASLAIRSGSVLHGRYWGSLEPIRCLHFEACYYRPIEWAIAQGIERYEGGAQGAHKLARGLLPAVTHSVHWIAEPRFAGAIDEYLARERIGVAHTLEELQEASPFKSDVVT